ncbi:uncharacterized protein LOC126234315 [Schistocerca nitens]|uniref:uncharacterized protein LOC126234315 n=1 Tax=Schistocerca nitens TaxID=7011 RepID=UPI00211800F9|nr:uncharacterized protein LOC126234315 [Schistocerca nitens]
MCSSFRQPEGGCKDTTTVVACSTGKLPWCQGGKHCAVRSPAKSGSNFFNHKTFFSTVSFGLVSANYCFLYTDVDCQGRISDRGVFRSISFSYEYEASMIIPSQINRKKCPMLLLEITHFTSTIIMKPFCGEQPRSSMKRIFNCRLSRAWRIFKNAFRIVSSIFCLLYIPP